MAFGLGLGLRLGLMLVGGGAADVVAPTLVSATTNAAGTQITLTYSEALDPVSVPAAGAYSLAGGGSSAVDSVSVPGGATVVLGLSTPLFFDHAPLINYTPGGAPIQDLAGNDAAALVSQAVTNITAPRATDPLSIVTSKTWLFYVIGDLGFSAGAWLDQSGAGKDAIQATGSAQPVAGGGLNGKATVLGDGVDDRMTFTTLDPTAPATTPVFLWSVLNQRSWTAARRIHGGGTSTTLGLIQNSTTPNVACSNATTSPNVSMPVNTWHRVEVLYNNSAAADYLKVGANSTGVGVAFGNNNVSLGAYTIFAQTAAGLTPANVEFAVHAMLNGKPTAPELARLDAWVTAYYGVTVAV
jgi:hypothetical protein